MSQSSNTVIMVRPHHFASNPETLADNSFQSATVDHGIAAQAYAEVNHVAAALERHGVSVHIFDDETTQTPDSVFPNNWFSTHSSGELVLYPMFCNNRRQERRGDIIDFLRSEYGYSRTIDLTHLEQQELFLEGTGSIVFDHLCKRAYATRSKRMSEAALTQLCQQIGYQMTVFDATNSAGAPVYHTNVLMAVGSQFVMAAVEMIRDEAQRRAFVDAVSRSGKVMLELSESQITQFAGNTLELQPQEGKLLVISTTGYRALTEEQVTTLEQWVRLLPVDVPTIELGGGSIRCMLAEVFKPS